MASGSADGTAIHIPTTPKNCGSVTSIIANIPDRKAFFQKNYCYSLITMLEYLSSTHNCPPGKYINNLQFIDTTGLPAALHKEAEN